MTKLKLIFTLILISFAVSFAFGQQPPPPGNFDRNDIPQNRNQFIAQELNLTDEQKLQWRQINRLGRQKTREAQERIRDAKDVLDDLVYADSINESLIQAKLREVVEAQAEVTKIRTMSELAVRNILSPEQVVKFRKLRKRFKKQQERRRLNRQRRQRQRNLNNRRNPNRINRPPQRNRRPI